MKLAIPVQRLSIGLVAILVTALSAAAGLERESPLDAFMKGRLCPDQQVLREKLSHWIKKADAIGLEDRGVAIANLQYLAWLLLDVPDGPPVAVELLDKWVLPNEAMLRKQPKTSACSWESVLFGAYACYARAGDPARQKNVLKMISTQSRDRGLRSLATLQLAALRVDAGEIKQALAIASKAEPTGELSDARAALVKHCEEQLKNRSTKIKE